MNYVIPIMQTVDDGVAIRVGHAVRMEDDSIFVLDIDRESSSIFLRNWFDRIASFNPQS